jgi:cell division septation protein DedD
MTAGSVSAALGFSGSALIVDTLVKERLTGAVILVSLFVVVVPELLSGPIRPASRTHGAASSAEEPPLRSYTISLADEPHGSVSLQMQPANAPSAPAPAAQPAGAAHAPEPAPPARTMLRAPNPPPAAASGAGTSTGAYVVQLGSFASRSNAERLAAQVHGQGFQVSVSRGSAGRRLYRVQVGPAHDRAAAEQLAGQLRAKGHGGAVVAK